MILAVNIGKLTKLVEAFYKLTKIKVAVYDDNFVKIFSYPEQDSSFCEMIHRLPVAAANCDESVRNICAKCREVKRLVTLTCHAGLTETVAPLYENDLVIGYIMFGQITNIRSKKRFIERAEAACGKYELDRDEFSQKVLSVPFKSNEQLLSVSEIINAFTAYIYLQDIVSIKKEDTLSLLLDYIDGNLASDLSVQTLCKKFFISKTSLYHLTKKIMPDGVANYVRTRRIEKAGELLSKTKYSVDEIATMVGFADTDYFRRIFKSEMGMPANAYRKAHGS